MKKMTLAALTVTVLAGCASSDSIPTASREETYTPLGTFLPRKTGNTKDERTYIDKEEFKRQQDMTPAVEGKP